MKCQDCNKNDASIHLTQIVNNEKVVLNLCKSCAEKRGFHSPFEQMPFPLAEIVSGMVGSEKSLSKDALGKDTAPDLTCSNCGLTFAEFGRVGRLGCAECYKVFRTELNSLLRRVHGSAEHRGRIAKVGKSDYKQMREERRLRDDLQKAIEDEDFELAAEIRDQIKELTTGVGKEA